MTPTSHVHLPAPWTCRYDSTRRRLVAVRVLPGGREVALSVPAGAGAAERLAEWVGRPRPTPLEVGPYRGSLCPDCGGLTVVDGACVGCSGAQ